MPTETKKAEVKTPLSLKVAVAIGLLAWVWACIYLSQLLSHYLFRGLISVFHLGVGTILESIYSVFVYLLALLLMLGVPALLRKIWPKLKSHPLFEKPTREELGLRGLPTWTDLLLSPVGFIVQLVLGGLLVSLFTLFPWFNASEAQNVGYTDLISTGDKLLAFLVIAVVAPLVEEIIFRGFLYGRLRKHLGLVPSLLLTSLLFAFLHGQWNVAVNVFATSVVLCALREVTGTIYSGILVHILKNAFAFYLLFIAL